MESKRSAPRRHGPLAAVWLTGLSGSGKSTLAQALCTRLTELHIPATVLDGDVLRAGLNRDLGFSPDHRNESVRRCAEVSRILLDAGVIPIAALISPYREQRLLARGTCRPYRFVEVFVDTTLELAESRDPKGLYKRARAGEIRDFTGIDSPYEPPTEAELRIDGANTSVAQGVELLVHELMCDQPGNERLISSSQPLGLQARRCGAP